MASLTVKNISKVYQNGHKALEDVNFKAVQGELVVIIGPSGCGKTTLLRVISGLEEPTEGEVLMNNTTVNHLPPKKREVSMVSQNYSLFPHMNVYDNIAFPLLIASEKKEIVKKKVSEVLKLLSISQLQKRKPSQLSGGEKQRTALGRAIIRQPKLFLFDEPLSGLDAGLRQEIREEIAKIQRYLRTTAIYVTHDQEEAMSLADKIIVMKDGRILQTGNPIEVYSKPGSLYVSQLTGKTNLFRGVFKTNNGELAFKQTNTGRILFSVSPEYIQDKLNFEINTDLIVAFRPEDILPDKPASDKKVISFSASLVSIEHKGYETIAILNTVPKKSGVSGKNDIELIYRRLAPDANLEGQEIFKLYLDIKKISIFKQ